jgi:4'-phosphopantetheinyl transferase
MVPVEVIYNPVVWQPAVLPDRAEAGAGTDVWKVDVNAAYGIVAAHRKLLTPEELERGNRFRRLEDANRFYTSRVVLKLLLAAYTGVAAEEIQLQRSTAGKPEANYPVHFNISHSGNYVLLAFARQPVGVDIEYMREDFDYAPVAAQIFHPYELAYMLAPGDVLKRFYLLWTRKEAYLKMTGQGLNDQLAQLHTLHRPAVISFDVDKGYMGAVALGEEVSAPEIVYRQLIAGMAAIP